MCPARIEASLGVAYSHADIVGLPSRVGFSYKKAREVPCERGPGKQRAFMDRLAALAAEMDASSVIYYADGVHPAHNSRSTHGWIERGREFGQPTVSGRDRLNVNALLNAGT